MPYSTDEDLFDRLSEDQVRRLTDEDGTGQVDEQLTARLRTEAMQYIDARLRGRYDLPLAEPTPAILKQIEVSLLAAKLYSRRANLETPGGIRAQEKDALADLKMIGRGEIDLGVEAGDDESGSGSYRALTEDATLNDQMAGRY